MTERNKMMWLLPVTGFFVVIAFGVGVIATAAYDSNNPFGVPAAAAPEGDGQVIQVELGDLFIKPAKLTAEAGSLVIEVHNGGGTQHNFSLGKLGSTPMLDPEQSYSLTLKVVAPGEYDYICQVPGHADAGMRGVLTVTGASGHSTDGDNSSSTSMAGMSPKEMAAHDAEVTGSFPAKTKGHGGEILPPEVLADGTKRFELTADEIKWETEPGKTINAVAYNGMIPGPTITANLGDHVQIVLKNELAEPTTIHFHGMTVPPDMDGVPVISQDAVLPGESFTYEFTVKNTGSNMYHSHFDAQNQVPGGLLGAFIVADPHDPKVALDYTMVLNDG